MVDTQHSRWSPWAFGFCLGLFLILRGPVLATDYTDAANGNWNASATWNPSSAYPLAAADTASIASYTVTIPEDYPYVSIGNITLSGAGILKFGADTAANGACITNWSPITLAGGGTITRPRWCSAKLNGTITVTGGTNTFDCPNSVNIEVNAPIVSTTAACTLVKKGSMYDDAKLTLNSPCPNYTGDWLVQLGNLAVYANDALGKGNLTVDGTADNGQPGQTVYVSCYSNPCLAGTAGPASITVKNGGIFQIRFGNNGTSSVNWTNNPVLTVNNGTIHLYFGDNVNWYNPVFVTNTATFLETYPTLRFKGPISGPGRLKLTGSVANGGNGRLDGTNNTYSGGTIVQDKAYACKAPQGANAGALGTGPVTVNASSTLYLQDLDGAANWTLPNGLAGKGTIQVEDASGNYTLTASGSAVSPGTNNATVSAGSVGVLTVSGALAFTNNGPQYARLNIDIARSNNVAGVDYDQLAVSKSVTALGYADLMVNVASNLPSAVVSTQVFTIVTCTNDTSLGAAFHSKQWPGGWRGDVVYGAGFVQLRNLRKVLPATLLIVL